jgi:hypothetical protein
MALERGNNRSEVGIMKIRSYSYRQPTGRSFPSTKHNLYESALVAVHVSALEKDYSVCCRLREVLSRILHTDVEFTLPIPPNKFGPMPPKPHTGHDMHGVIEQEGP